MYCEVSKNQLFSNDRFRIRDNISYFLPPLYILCMRVVQHNLIKRFRNVEKLK